MYNGLDWTWMFGAEWGSLVWWMICRVIILGAVETTARWDRDTYLPQTLSFYQAATISLWRVILIEITPSQKRKEATCRDLHRVTLKEKSPRELKKNKTVSHLISYLNPQIRYEISKNWERYYLHFDFGDFYQNWGQ